MHRMIVDLLSSRVLLLTCCCSRSILHEALEWDDNMLRVRIPSARLAKAIIFLSQLPAALSAPRTDENEAWNVNVKGVGT